MNALYGYLLFDGQADYAAQNRHIAHKVRASFPRRFKGARQAGEGSFGITGDFDLAQATGNSTANNEQLFFNGEIYNRNEIERRLNMAGGSYANDAALINELILREGPAAAGLINGQFLIIKLYPESGRMLLINDHNGIRQLYYYQSPRLLVFATEIKFLLIHPEVPKKIDWESSLSRPDPRIALSCYKSYNAWFKNVYMLREGSVLLANGRSAEVKITPYFNIGSLPGYDYSGDTRNAGQVMEQYVNLLDDSIRIRCKNEPVAYSLLSGGLDSSAIVALAARHNPVETFSIITQTTCLEGTTAICRRLADDLHVKNFQYLVPAHEMVFNAELWKRWIWRMESPVNHIDSLTKTMIHYAIAQNKPEAKAIYTGTGSDQLNGGLARWIVNDSGNPDENWQNFSNAIKNVENNKLVPRANEELWNLRNFINRDFLVGLSDNKVEANSWMFYVDKAHHGELFSLVWDEVRAGNYHGHELRFPFLDFRFIDFIAKIPPHLQKKLFYDKAILRTPASKFLPGYLSKPKAPAYRTQYDFRVNLFKFLTKNNREAIVEEALGHADNAHDVINKKELLRRMEKMQQEPDIIEWLNIMRIINLCLLEKLPGKTESAMDMEVLTDAPRLISFENPEKANLFLKERLLKADKEPDLERPLRFSAECSLLTDRLNNKIYLSKKNELVFEIEQQNPHWEQFLAQIDNRRSTRQILDGLKISYGDIEEFFKIAMEEELLTTATKY